MLLMVVPTESLSAAAVLTLKVTDAALVVTVPEAGVSVSHFGTFVIVYFTLPLVAFSEKLNDVGENGPPCCPDAAMFFAETCSRGGLTVSVAVRV
jgi:hypothetical protein